MDVLLFLLTFPLVVFFIVLFSVVAYRLLKYFYEMIEYAKRKRRYRKWLR